jgi:hypothetical protein
MAMARKAMTSSMGNTNAAFAALHGVAMTAETHR